MFGNSIFLGKKGKRGSKSGKMRSILPQIQSILTKSKKFQQTAGFRQKLD
jgi:hypothetical protein